MHDIFRWGLILAVVAFYGFGALALALSKRTADAASAPDWEGDSQRTWVFASPVTINWKHRPPPTWPELSQRRQSRAALYTHAAVAALFSMAVLDFIQAVIAR